MQGELLGAHNPLVSCLITGPRMVNASDRDEGVVQFHLGAAPME